MRLPHVDHGAGFPFQRLLALDPRDIEPRGPAGRPPRLDAAVRSFATGYNTALSESPAGLDFPELPLSLRGFAFEGAAMSCTLLDLMTLSRGRRLHELAAGTGQRYIHLIHVGAGWAYARLRLRPWLGVRFGHPMLRWLAWDGWGFHQAYFDPGRVFDRRAIERGAGSGVRPIRDQGAGRALWFHAAADPERIGGIIGAFPVPRRRDLWAGIGLAACYTAAQPPPALDGLLDAAAGHHEHLAQGAAFAAKAHALAGTVPDDVAAAAERLTGVPAPQAAAWTDAALIAAGSGPDTPQGYERWRAGIRRAWARQETRQETRQEGATT